jgi:hypothetical protein
VIDLATVRSLTLFEFNGSCLLDVLLCDHKTSQHYNNSFIAGEGACEISESDNWTFYNI